MIEGVAFGSHQSNQARCLTRDLYGLGNFALLFDTLRLNPLPASICICDSIRFLDPISSPTTGTERLLNAKFITQSSKITKAIAVKLILKEEKLDFFGLTGTELDKKMWQQN